MSQIAARAENDPQNEAPEKNAPDSDVENKENEPLRQVFEYRDSAGNLIGRAIVEMGQAAELGLAKGDQEFSADARALNSFVWQGEKDGKPTEIDILALIQREGDDAFILDDTNVDAYGVYPGAEDGTSTIVAPKPENAVDMAFFLHEFGHADQFRSENVGPLKSLYAHEGKIRKLSLEQLSEQLDAVAEAMPETQEAVAEAKSVIPQLANLENRANNLRFEALALKSKIEGNPSAESALADADRLNYLNDQLATTEKAKQHIMDEVDPYAIALVPGKTLEIDASMRAIDWMQRIKEETGSDMFAPLDVPKSSTISGRKESAGCADSAEQARSTGGRALTTAKAELKKALETYKATDLIPDDTFEEAA